jgi:hypothetical protein
MVDLLDSLTFGTLRHDLEVAVSDYSISLARPVERVCVDLVSVAQFFLERYRFSDDQDIPLPFDLLALVVIDAVLHFAVSKEEPSH